MRHFLLDAPGGDVSLEVETADDVDLDSTFYATCLDTGERLRINGWLFIAEEI